jgi:hypothetical protein
MPSDEENEEIGNKATSTKLKNSSQTSNKTEIERNKNGKSSLFSCTECGRGFSQVCRQIFLNKLKFWIFM